MEEILLGEEEELVEGQMHGDKHSLYVEDCFACKIRSIRLKTYALEQMRNSHTTEREIEQEIIQAARDDTTGTVDIQRKGVHYY